MKYGILTKAPNPFDVGRLVFVQVQDLMAVCTDAHDFKVTVPLNDVSFVSEEVFNHLTRSRIEAVQYEDPAKLPPIPGLAEFIKADWIWVPAYDTWEIRFEDANGVQIVTWIAKRPSYCDRGSVSAHIEGISSIDEADGFPRYYMTMEVAKREMKEWLLWRVFKHRSPH
jgi:hypothetical protein